VVEDLRAQTVALLLQVHHMNLVFAIDDLGADEKSNFV
jgi:hypothetical protein